MKIVFIILGLLVLALIIFMAYRYLTVKMQGIKLNRIRYNRIMQLLQKLDEGILTAEDVLPYAQNLLTRESIYNALKSNNKTELFPSEYYTLVKGAESNLASWLEFPTELNACPDEIEYIKRVTIDFDGQQHYVHYETFRYRMKEPHWAAKDGWCIGVVGPYFDDSEPYDFPGCTFSRIGTCSDPDEEATWVHEKLSKRRR